MQSDREELNIIIKIVESLYININKLKELELNNKRNSNEYNNLLEAINSTKKLLKTLIFNLNIDSIREFIAYLNIQDFSSLNIMLDSAIDSKDIIRRKVVIELSNVLNNNLINQLKELSVDYEIIFIVNKKVRKDILKTIIYLLDIYINDSNYISIKEMLISFKYNLIFYDEELLDDLLSNNFFINEKLYWEHMLYLNKETATQILYDIEVSGVELFNEYMKKIVHIENNNYEYGLAIIYQIIIRTSLILLPNEDVITLKERLYSAIEEVKEEFGEDLFSNSMLLKCFDYYNKDREIPNILKLKL